MLDGGIADSIPVRKAIADGFDHNIVILTRHKGYYKEERTDATIRIAKLYYHRYPMLVKALSQRAHVYNRTLDLLDRLEQTATCVSRTERDLEKLEDFYWHGYEEAKRLYPQLHAWLEQREECVSRKRLLR